MKFIHIADAHLGQEPDPGYPWSKDWGRERLATFGRLIEVCNREEVDLLLIAGDLFQGQPSKAELKEVDYAFSRLTRTKVVLIAGNHDYLSPSSPLTTYEFCDKVTFLRDETPQTVTFPDLNCQVTGFSYHHKQITAGVCDDLKPGTEMPYQILLAHGGDANHVPLQFSSLKEAGFSYVALGHIHKPFLWVEEKIAFAGCLEAYDRGDVGPRGYIEGDITSEGTTFSFVPFSSRQYVAISMKISPDVSSQAITDRLKAVIRERGPKHIYKVTLTGSYDTECPPDVELIKTAGNVVQVTVKAVPAFDLDALYDEHYFDVIGLYIQSFDREHMTDTEQKALYDGLYAMMYENVE